MIMEGALRSSAVRMLMRGMLSRLALAGLVGAALFASGCVTTTPMEWVRNGFKVGPNYSRPPAPVASDWIEGQDPSVQKHHLDDWWSVFQDPTLNSLIETAYRQNLNLRTLGSRVLEARAQQAIAVGNFFPQTQQMNGQYSRVNVSRNSENNPSAISSAIPPGAPPPSLVSNFYSDWNTGFNLTWEADFWGRFRRAIESSNATLDASVENYDDALVTLLADVATYYVDLRVAQERIKIAKENARIQEGVVEITVLREQAGRGSAMDVEQARTILEATLATIPAQEITLGQANDNLCTLLGLPPRDLEPELGPGPELGKDVMANVPTWVAAGIPADLLRRRPDIRSAERQVAAQSAQIGVAEADLYPSFYLNGTLGWDAADLAKLFESKSFFGTITPNFRWNILNYGRILNNVHLQDAHTQELVASYQNRVLTGQKEVQTALRGFLQSQMQAKRLVAAVKAATTATQLGVEQFKGGTTDLNRVYNLESSQVQQEDSLAVAQGNIALNLINVYRALGGGWELRLEQDGHSAASPADSSANAAKSSPPRPDALPAPAVAPHPGSPYASASTN
jgi:NodT family efflux transporter outer membrane factor (OMF) lipoprotein